MSSELIGDQNLVRFVAKKRQLEGGIDPQLFLLRPVDKGSLSAWLSDNTSLSERWEAGYKLLKKSGCCGSADITAKNLYSIPTFKLSAQLTKKDGHHVDIYGLPSPNDKSEALRAAQELARIATPVLR